MKQLPADLRGVARRAVLRRVIPCVLLEAGLVVLMLLVGDDLFGDTPMPAAVIYGLYTLLLVVPPLVTGVPLKMRDKTWCGTVKEVKTADGVAFEYAVARGGKRYDTLVTTMTVRTPDGETLQRTVTHAGRHAQLKSEGYRVGDRVFHLYGSPYTVVIPEKQSDICRCAVCGGTNLFEESHCHDCGHTLVR